MNGYYNEAKHVKEFCRASLKSFFYIKRALSPKHLKELSRSHQYLLIKSFKMHQLLSRHLAKKGMTAPYAPIKSCLQKTPSKRLSNFITNRPQSERGLSQKRVHGWKLREFVLAKQKLEELNLASASYRTHTITSFEDPADSNLYQQTQEWQDLLSAKEERHFQITRITRILSS